MQKKVLKEKRNYWEKSRNLEYDIIENLCKNFGSPCRLLEVGCGELGLLTKQDRLANLFQNSVGIDIAFGNLSKNKQVKYKICADCNYLPLKDKSVDILVTRWVIEHLENPEIAIKEFARVLSKGGYLYILTPNLLNYAMLISKFTPQKFHDFIRKNGGGHENTPTYYRANTKWRLKKLASNNGFIIRYMVLDPYSFMYYKKFFFFIMRKISISISNIFSPFHLKLTVIMERT